MERFTLMLPKELIARVNTAGKVMDIAAAEIVRTAIYNHLAWLDYAEALAEDKVSADQTPVKHPWQMRPPL